MLRKSVYNKNVFKDSNLSFIVVYLCLNLEDDLRKIYEKRIDEKNVKWEIISLNCENDA